MDLNPLSSILSQPSSTAEQLWLKERNYYQYCRLQCSWQEQGPQYRGSPHLQVLLALLYDLKGSRLNNGEKGILRGKYLVLALPVKNDDDRS